MNLRTLLIAGISGLFGMCLVVTFIGTTAAQEDNDLINDVKQSKDAAALRASRGPAGANANQTSIELAKQQKSLAQNALQRATSLENQSQLDPGMRDVPRWSRRLVEATRKSGASKAEVAEAMKEHQARMDERLRRIKAKFDAAVVTEGVVWSAEYEALEAKMWMQESLEN
jgi:hypothetical protein